MTKKDIKNLANTMGFKLDYDQSNIDGKEWMRFVSEDNSLDEKELRWIWFMKDSDEENIARGIYIQNRLKKKKEIQKFLKY